MTPKSISGTILTTTWWLFALMTGAAYISGLVVILFRARPHIHALPFGSVDEMVKQKDVEILCVKDSATYNYIANHKGVSEQKVYEMWKTNWGRLMVDSMDTALKMMDDNPGKYAVFMDEAKADYLASAPPCDKMVIGDPVGDRRFGMACRKGSTLCEDLNPGILHMQETGQMERLRAKWFWSGCHMSSQSFYGEDVGDSSFDGTSGSDVPLKITVRRFTVAFVVMAIGLGLAMGFLILEVVCSARKGNIRLKNYGGNDEILGINRDT